jgi:large subunit ribosomal protein L9
MRVVFVEEIESVGRIGEVKNVADGYARNYLLPRKLAIPATPAALKQAEARAQVAAKQQEKLDQSAQAQAAKLEGKALTIKARVGEQGRLFGSVTAADIAEALASTLGVEEFDRHQVELEQPLREIGQHEVSLRLSRNVRTNVTVDVVPEE